MIARFHATADRSPEADRAAGRDALAGRWAANTTGLEPFAGRFVDAGAIEAVEALAPRYLAGREPLFATRVAAGRARDGHGDLLADDIFLLDDGPRVLDCLEFDDALRLDDVLADVAFLAMDLERLGRPDLAERFLAAYRAASGDTWPASLAHHHIAYRAQVRAKVSAIRADQGVPDSAEKAQSAAPSRPRAPPSGPGPPRARRRAARNRQVDRRSRHRRGERRRRPALRCRAEGTGRARARSSPRAPRYQHGIYTPDATAAVYEELVRRAEDALRRGEIVVLDASWTDDSRPHRRSPGRGRDRQRSHRAPMRGTRRRHRRPAGRPGRSRR